MVLSRALKLCNFLDWKDIKVFTLCMILLATQSSSVSVPPLLALMVMYK